MENRMKHYVRLLSVALAAMLALSACGFKLRGTGPQPTCRSRRCS